MIIHDTLKILDHLARDEGARSISRHAGRFRGVSAGAARAAELGDTGDSAPSGWLPDPEAAHIAVLIPRAGGGSTEAPPRNWSTSRPRTDAALLGREIGAARFHMHPVGTDGDASSNSGYRIGISQPWKILRVRTANSDMPKQPPACLILGIPTVRRTVVQVANQRC